MMRYQRVSPDCLPLTNGSTKKPYLRPSPSRSNENGTSTVGIRFNGGAVACTTTTTSIINSSSTLDGVPKGFRFRSPSTTQQQQDLPNDSNSNPSRRNGDVLLQWGQRKRSRVSRTEIRSTTTATATAADDSSSSSGQSLMPSNKLQRRSVNPSMPPPPPPLPPPQSTLCNSGGGRSITNTRNGFVVGKESSRFIPTRHLEDRSANGSASRNIGGSSRMVSRSVNATGTKRSPPSPNKTETRSSGRDQHHHNQRQLNGFDHTHHHNHHHHHHHHPQRMNRSESTAQVHLEMETTNNGEKATQLEVIEWPRIYIALSRKEKEEDFLAIKGTKLPHRPRKRPRNVDKTLQYCFPGLSLSDVNKSRYEVREKKSAKKQQKRRGLKGMESLDSDSE